MKIVAPAFLAAIITWAAFLPVAAYSETPDEQWNYYQAPETIDSYFIGVHRPDGSCVTVEIFARTLAEALNVAKMQYGCDICIVEDMTATYKSGDPTLLENARLLCPLL